MLKGISEEKLYELQVECEKKSSEKLKALWARAYKGEITSKDEMIEELKSLNLQFQDEMEDYCTSPWDLTEDDIKLVEKSDGSVRDIANTKF